MEHFLEIHPGIGSFVRKVLVGGGIATICIGGGVLTLMYLTGFFEKKDK